MSQSKIELVTIQAPSAIAKPTTSIRRANSVQRLSTRLSGHLADDGSDDRSLHSLERSDSATTVTSNTQTTAIIASVTLITAISTLLNGLTTVALPTMAVELNIPESLLLWPTSIQALTNGCSLLISGSIADVLGARFMYLAGCILQAGFVLGCGLSKSSADLILFRGLSGIAISFCLPSATAIITRSFVGRRRNLAFASMGGGQPIGFGVGLALGGVLTDTIGWRWGFYISAVFDVVLCAVAYWGLPAAIDSVPDAEGAGAGAAELTWSQKWSQLKNDVDWVGAVIASTSLAMLSYTFAAISGSTTTIRDPTSIALLSIAVALVPIFILWVGRQEKLGRPAIIPNSLWHNTVFTSICLSVFLTWGSFNALETMLTFFFQRVQGLNAIETSLRFLPAPISGALANVFIGMIVHRVPGNWLVVGASLLSAISPLAMTFATPSSSYWSSGFVATMFNPTGADSLFTISNLVITSVFPAKTQALAGGVFNTISQIGKAVGLALVAVIAASITKHSDDSDKSSPEALLKGYKATFWFCFAWILTTVAISLLGLRKIGKVGAKRD